MHKEKMVFCYIKSPNSKTFIVVYQDFGVVPEILAYPQDIDLPMGLA